MLAPMTSRAKVREAMSAGTPGFEQPGRGASEERASEERASERRDRALSYDYGDIQHTRTKGV